MIGAIVALALAGPLAYDVPEAGIFTRGERLLKAGYDPAWSPDGSRLAFVLRGDLHVADADGSRDVPLTASPGRESDPAWAPDGRRIAVERDGAIWIVRADAVAERRLAAGGDPAWAPDGKRLAFVRDGDVWTVGADGRGGRRVTSGPAEERAPSWWPRGARLAYSSDLAGNREVHTVGTDGRGAVRLTNDVRDDGEPAWSPDGRRIAFVRDGDVWAMSGDGRVQRRVARRGGSPSWRPLPRARELLPDLDQRAPHSLTVTRWRNRWVVGFSSAVDNVGNGPLWLLGARGGGSSRMDASQRIAVAGGRWRIDRPIGFWRYVFADSHGHWHFLPFERYELRDAKGRALVRDHKSGFCLGDRFRHAPVAAARPRFPPGACQSGNPSARSVYGGTSIGYTDRYFPHYHGQNLTLNGVRAGVYTLVHRVNPELLFREARYDNNAASVRVRLMWTRGSPIIRVLRVCERSARC